MNHLLTEFEYYLDHQGELLKTYKGKVLVVKDRSIVGSYEDELSAVRETVKQGHERGTFLVQRCSPGDRDYTAWFYSPRIGPPRGM